MGKHDDKIQSSNFLSSAMVGAPAIGGLSFAMHRMIKGGGLTVPVTSTVTQATNAIRGMAAGSVADITNQAGARFMGQNADFFRSSEGREVARRAWMSAVNAVDPAASEILSFAGNIETMPAGNVPSAIKSTLQANQSIYMGKISSRFQQNVGAFRKHYDLTGVMPQLREIKDLSFPPPRNMAVNQLPPELAAAHGRIKKQIGNLGIITGVTFQTKGGWQREGFGLYRFNFNVRGMRFGLDVPYSSGGVLLEGATQSSKRIAPGVSVFTPGAGTLIEEMTRHEYLLKRFESGVLQDVTAGKYSSQFDIKRQIGKLYAEDIYALENIPNLPQGLRNRGREAEQAARAKAMDVRILTQEGLYRVGTEEERTMAIEVASRTKGATPLLPSTSPKNIAQGTFSALDPRQWSMTPSFVSFARRPSQAMREWRMTPAAVKATMDAGSYKWSIFETQAWRSEIGPNVAPHVRTLYIDPAKFNDLLGKQGLTGLIEGETVLMSTKGMQQQMEQFRMADPVHLREVRPDIQDIIAGRQKVQAGEILGTTSEGAPFTFKRGMKLKGIEQFQTSGRGDFSSLFFEETRYMKEAEKKFQDIKAMEREISPREFRRKLKPIKRMNPLLTQGVMRIASMDELTKDASKANKQMISGLWDLIDKMRTRDFVQRNKRLASFMRNPRVLAAHLEAKGLKAATAGLTAQEAFIGRLMGFAIGEGRTTPQEFGAIFGAAPSLLTSPGALKAIVPPKFRAHLQSLSVGISQGIYPGPEWPELGIRASLEPRAYDILKGGQFGPVGADIAEDFMRRTILAQPEKLSTFEALTKTLQSVAGRRVIPKGATVFEAEKYTHQEFKEFIEKGGGRLKLGKKLPDIYVPGPAVVPEMMGYKTAGGSLVTSNLPTLYHDLARSTGKMYDDIGKFNAADAKGSLNEFIAGIYKQHAPLGKKERAGAFVAGQTMGGRFLTGVSEIAGYAPPNPKTAGIPKEVMREMMREMKATGLYSDQEYKDALEMLKKTGKTPGIIARHPFTSPGSLQAVMFEEIAAPKGTSTVAIPTYTALLRLTGEAKASLVKFSPLGGTLGDLDADAFAVFLTDPKTHARLRKQIHQTDGEFFNEYMNHTVRTQLITAKATAEEGRGLQQLTTIQKIMADARKLGTVEEWVPKVSTEMGAARQAAVAHLKGKELADAMFMIQWMEQQPIGGKHLSQRAVLKGEMSQLLRTMGTAMSGRNRERMQLSIEGMMEHASDLSKRLLTEKVAIEEGVENLRRIPGFEKASIRNVLPGLDVAKTVDNIATSLEMADQLGTTEANRMAAGRAKVDLSNLNKYLGQVGPVLGERPGAFSDVIGRLMATKNYAAAAGMGVLKYKKAIGFGFLGSIALATILSKPDDLIGPGSALIERSRIKISPTKAANRMKPETMLPPGHQMGDPSAPSRIHVPTAHIAPGGDSVRVSVNARTRGNVNHNELISRLRVATGNNSTLNLNIRDNSHTLNMHALANKLL